MGENKNERFQRLAKARAAKLADELRKIANLSSTNYEYTEDQVEKLFEYIEQRVADSRSRFDKFSTKQVPALEF